MIIVYLDLAFMKDSKHFIPGKHITLFPNAKINLGLLIKGKREDGYHLLETVFYPVFSLQDTLVIERAEDYSFQIEGIKLDSNAEDNLCTKAYKLLQSQIEDLPPVALKLTKNIPAGAGLGGGSSDAAHTLTGLNQLFELGLSNAFLADLGKELGADVPFFIYNKPLLAKGIGTDFEEIDIDFPFEIKLICPDIHSSTIAAYKALDYKMFDPKRSLREILAQPASEWKSILVNDMEVPVIALYPEIAQIKEDLYTQGALYACMSGSGSSVFGLFSK